MVKPSDSNADSRSGQGSSPAEDAVAFAQQELTRGVVALKTKDYDTALRIFQQLEQSAPAFQTKARMGMVQVYQLSGNAELAREKCQELLTNPSPKIRHWAQQALAKLPLSNEALQDNNSSSRHHFLGTEDKSSFGSHDKSGFVPLDPSPEELGEPLSPASRTSFRGSQVPSSERDTGFTPMADSASRGEAEIDKAPETEPHQSLFHYQQLNQQTGIPAAAQPSMAGKAVPPVQVTPSTPEASIGPTIKQKPQQGQKRPSGTTPAKGLKLDKPYRLWLVQGVTAIATLWLIHWGIHQSLRLVNDTLRLVRWPIRLNGFEAFDRPHLWLVIILGALTTLASPWLFDRLLVVLYQQNVLSTRQLQSHCPDALRLMRRVCRQREWQVPELRLIPDSIPLSFSYGWSPRTARIVISQGLLDALNNEELTALYAYEMAHVANWDMPVLSGLSFLLFLLYSGYWSLSQWGDRRQKQWLKVLTGVIASFLYGIFWLLRKLGLWLSRVRGEYCDCTSLLITRQPQHHQRLLLNLTQRISEDVTRRGYLHPLLVSLDVLMPLSPNQAVSPGSFLDDVGVPRLIAEDCLNRYRHWLVANNSHPIFGERLLFLEQWANHWHQPSLGLTVDQLGAQQPENPGSHLTVQDLVLQNSPVIGLVVGGGIALSLWFIGGVVNRLNWQQVSWLYQDDSILQGGLLIGLGMGMLMRVNRLFPENRSSQAPLSSPETLRLFDRPPTLPMNGRVVTLQGTLVGPAGTPNVLCQNLFLKEETGLLRLQATSPLSWWQGLTHRRPHPASWIGRQVTISGWQRRAGGKLWIDLNSIRVAGQPVYQVYAPQWTTGLGIAVSLWGVWIIFSGG